MNTVIADLFAVFALALIVIMPFEVMPWRQAVSFLVTCFIGSIPMIIGALKAKGRMDRLEFSDLKAHMMVILGAVCGVVLCIAVPFIIAHTLGSSWSF